MEKKNVSKYIKLAITLAIVIAFIWFLVVYPYIDFKSNEKKLEEAAKRYFDIYETELPTGNRIKTLTLQDLAHKSFLKEDIYITYSKKPCDLKESWVKVQQKDGEYKYFVYLQCGVIKSKTDHSGPIIILNGDDEITINNGDKYEELGVKKVTDETDGTMDIKEVTIDSSKVDTSKNGVYKVTYTISDSFDNKTVKERTINVIQTLSHTIEKNTKNGTYQGYVENNYIKLSNILFRIVGKEGNNVKIVTDSDIANVNYEGIDEWLEYFYENLTEESKKYIVKNKYCNDTLSEAEINTKKTCSKTTKNKYIHILSSKDMLNSIDDSGQSYLYPDTISWLANAKDNNEAWTTRYFFNNTAMNFLNFSKNYSFGIRPILTIKGDSLIKSGDGTINSPYSFNETEKGKTDEYINMRYIGEYINISGYDFRIINTESDGTTKVISDGIIEEKIRYQTSDNIKIYNPKQKGNIGYQINNKTSEYIDSNLFVNKEIEVPIYKEFAKYKEEDEINKYKVKFSSPSTHEIFSAKVENNSAYWLINSSKTQYRKYIVSDIGVVFYDTISDSEEANIRVVGYLNKNCKIISGMGTKEKPYKITK